AGKLPPFGPPAALTLPDTGHSCPGSATAATMPAESTPTLREPHSGRAHGHPAVLPPATPHAPRPPPVVAPPQPPPRRLPPPSAPRARAAPPHPPRPTPSPRPGAPPPPPPPAAGCRPRPVRLPPARPPRPHPVLAQRPRHGLAGLGERLQRLQHGGDQGPELRVVHVAGFAAGLGRPQADGVRPAGRVGPVLAGPLQEPAQGVVLERRDLGPGAGDGSGFHNAVPQRRVELVRPPARSAADRAAARHPAVEDVGGDAVGLGGDGREDAGAD